MNKLKLMSCLAVIVFGSTPSAFGASADSRMSACLSDAIEESDFHGVALVGNVASGFGVAARDGFDGATGSFDVDTRFNTGSAYKMFTAVAVMQLLGEHGYTIEKPIGEVVDDIPQAFREITFRQLLSHTSGMGNIFSPAFFDSVSTYDTLDDLRSFIFSEAPTDAGTYRYSNAGFVLLGLAIERMSGTSYEDYMAHSVLGVMGASATSAHRDAGTAAPFTRRRPPGNASDAASGSLHASTMPYHKGMPAGGYFTTAEDLFRFADALLSGRLVDKDALGLMSSTHASFERRGEARSYGLGFTISTDQTTIGHGGGAPGVNAAVRILPATGDVVIALTNVDPPMASRAAAGLLDNLTALFACGAGDAGAVPTAKLRQLTPLLGTWITQTHVTDDAGQTWQSYPEKLAIVDFAHTGKVIGERPKAESEAGFNMLNYITYDQYRDVFRKAAIDDTWGLMDIYEGGLIDGRLVVDNLRSGTFFPTEGGAWRGFRLTMELTRPNRTMMVEKTDDEGATWQPAFRVDYTLQQSQTR